MKRLWIGVIFLILLLALGIGSCIAFSRMYLPVSQSLQQASEAALSGDWDTASVLAEKARNGWEKWVNFTAAMADHEPMEEIDSLFAQLDVLLQMKKLPDFAALSSRLSRLTAAMAESQQLYWWHFL